MTLFDPNTLQKLEQLALVATKVRVGMMKGERRSRKRGSSIEFADYRDYVRGDDLRRLDWNIMARLEKPFIKLLEDEEDLAVHLLVDTSASMDWPTAAAGAAARAEAPDHKLSYALRTAAALGYIGLVSGDVVQVRLAGEEDSRHWGPHRGRQNGMALFRFLEQGQAAGTTNLNRLLTEYSQRASRPGLLFLISDLLSPAGYLDGLNRIVSQGFEVGLIQIVTPDEADPSFTGDAKLVDIETDAESEITLDAATLSLYRRRFQEWQAGIAAECRKRDVHFIPVKTDLPWERLVLHHLRQEGMLT